MQYASILAVVHVVARGAGRVDIGFTIDVEAASTHWNAACVKRYAKEREPENHLCPLQQAWFVRDLQRHLKHEIRKWHFTHRCKEFSMYLTQGQARY